MNTIQSKKRTRLLLVLALLLFLYGAYRVAPFASALGNTRDRQFLAWWRGDSATRAALVTIQREACPGAPFILPAEGFIGLLYGDPRGPYSPNRPHQGIDIFSNTDPGITPVYAAYDGYITREARWKSTLIQRVPQDPLHPERQIWLYYTHMADESGESDFIEPAFPPGTYDLFVAQGTLLGYTGNYSGSRLRSVWTHLHFSIVLDDGGRYRNELEFANTVDPSPYLGIDVDHETAAAGVAGCRESAGNASVP